MNKKVIICAGLIFTIGLIGYVLYDNLEIYEDKIFSSPSRDKKNDACANDNPFIHPRLSTIYKRQGPVQNFRQEEAAAHRRGIPSSLSTR